ncbi:MAG: capsule assembly Wzi family protein [Ignavibacteriaceae bacterium]
MRVIIRTFILVLILLSIEILAQVENVPLDHPVYTFLKEMKVKNILTYIGDDIPNLSRFQVKNYLKEIESKVNELSKTEKDFLERYRVEFYEIIDTANTNYFFQPGKGFSTTLSEAFSNKVKYFYAYSEDNANVYIEMIGHYRYGAQFQPKINNTHLFDIGFRFHGTLFNHLGYNLSFLKGGAEGNRKVAELIDHRLLQNYKWIENTENIGNYDFTEGYIKYQTEPVTDMNLSIQVGREQKTVGYGYSSSLILSGYGPPLDAIEFNFDYGIVHFTSIHGSTVGDYSIDRYKRYTKYWAFNRLALSFNNLFDIGIGESIIYSGRGLELAYLTPLGFYKFLENSVQDRDNGNLYFDLQTSFIPNLEIQATFLLDENILSNLQDLQSYKNKTAYQVGLFWYEAFKVNNLSLILEYTKIRPFVYTHFNIENNYTAWGTILGHPIGPNADELFTSLSYNLTDWVRLSCEYHLIRKGENVYDSEGNLIKNVGGDVNLTHGENPQYKEALFLDGIRVNNNVFRFGLRVEPIRDFIFYILYEYNNERNITAGTTLNQSYGEFRFTLNY